MYRLNECVTYTCILEVSQVQTIQKNELCVILLPAPQDLCKLIGLMLLWT